MPLGWLGEYQEKVGKNIGIGSGFSAIRAGELIDQGLPFAELCREVGGLRPAALRRALARPDPLPEVQDAFKHKAIKSVL